MVRAHVMNSVIRCHSCCWLRTPARQRSRWKNTITCDSVAEVKANNKSTSPWLRDALVSKGDALPSLEHRRALFPPRPVTFLAVSGELGSHKSQPVGLFVDVVVPTSRQVFFRHDGGERR